MSTLTFGIQTGERFRIGFDYYAHGRLYSDKFRSPMAIPQRERINVSYNPLKFGRELSFLRFHRRAGPVFACGRWGGGIGGAFFGLACVDAWLPVTVSRNATRPVR